MDKLTLKIRDEPKLQLNLQGKDTLNIALGQPVATGTKDYEKLFNKPQINRIELIGNRSLDELGIQKAHEAPTESISNTEIDDILSIFAS